MEHFHYIHKLHITYLRIKHMCYVFIFFRFLLLRRMGPEGHGIPLPHKQIVGICAQLALGLLHLHRAGVVHTDVAARNC